MNDELTGKCVESSIYSLMKVLSTNVCRGHIVQSGGRMLVLWSYMLGRTSW